MSSAMGDMCVSSIRTRIAKWSCSWVISRRKIIALGPTPTRIREPVAPVSRRPFGTIMERVPTATALDFLARSM